MKHYILKDHIVIEEPNLMRWAKWFESADRIVKQTEIGRSKVSTVFLGLDHSFGHGLHLLFETMVFGGPTAGEQERYETWEEAEAGHEQMVKDVKGA